uniref:Mitochondrial 39S ribosomal protein L55 n=1 Tax=Sphenodon punctatus TaxID=8508 RepID=A0A0F7GWW9_SPHPU|nr:mitochondrial 39S ribosomal protein L55 [Sphenodon punctatus]
MQLVRGLVTLLRLEALPRLLPIARGLHPSPCQHNSNRTSIGCLNRQKFGRTYPVLLVRPDGSTIHIHYKEPRRILSVPVDISTLPEAERKARLRKQEARKVKPKKEEDFEDEFNLEDYRKFWKKK